MPFLTYGRKNANTKWHIIINNKAICNGYIDINKKENKLCAPDTNMCIDCMKMIKQKIKINIRRAIWERYFDDINIIGYCYCCLKEISYYDYQPMKNIKNGDTNIDNVEILCISCHNKQPKTDGFLIKSNSQYEPMCISWQYKNID
jgi:hypothetical protein